jgi:allene oxide cyclase
VPVGFAVDVGWPWWAVTGIASGVFVLGGLGLVKLRRAAARTTAVIIGLEAGVIATVAPFALSSSTASGTAMATANVSDNVIHVIEHAPPPDMHMQGNLESFANPIFDATNTKRIGHDQGFCVHIEIAKTLECVWSTFFRSGQITAEGTATGVNAITGGSGAYANARGWVVVKTRNKAGTQFDEFFHISG